ncbi:MAG: DUF177 domain-containing protein [Acidobacteria bacterium]|nr:DUF177 domain-containing protein [Acidobacteriota bacterium]MBI3657410.1 DUF177 domain-containing protein [Acidobacteriota bacterium]
MHIVVHELEEPLQIDREFKGEGLGLAQVGAHLAAPVRLTATVTRSNKDVAIEGDIHTVMGLTCSRCLKVFMNQISQRIDLHYEPLPVTEGGQVLTYDDMDISYYTEDIIDVDQMLVEQLELAVPMKPVCAGDCQGLCDVCGVDLNVETCRCAREVVDDRLQPLIHIKKKLTPGN